MRQVALAPSSSKKHLLDVRQLNGPRWHGNHWAVKYGFTYKEKQDSNTQSETIVAEELERLEAIEETVTESDDVVTQLIDESTEEK
ncbi:hypothetical protein PC128_g5381 [Phytophthora cactorum]|nr:hypothetical protein PC128_g5381 [Phytophthora cactorum]